MTLPDQGLTSLTLHGTDVETPGSALVYTITTLPGTGSLKDGTGAPVTLNETFTGGPPVLYYQLPTEFLGALSTSFTFTVTDNGLPAGSGTNVLTSSTATVTIQTPSNSAGILRIQVQPALMRSLSPTPPATPPPRRH